VVTASAKPAVAPPLEAFFGGRAPAEVKLGALIDGANYHYTLKVPAGWKSSNLNGGDYMLQSADVSAVVLLLGTSGAAVNDKLLGIRAKQLPMSATELSPTLEPKVIEVGEGKWLAKAGHSKGKLAGEPGELYWLDMATISAGYDDHLAFLVSLKNTASEQTRKEAQALVRTMTPYKGQNLWELSKGK